MLFHLIDREALTVSVQVNDKLTGAPLDCTGLTVVLAADRRGGGPHVEKTAAWDNIATGAAELQFVAGDYDALRPGAYDYTLWLRDGAGVDRTLTQDQFEVRRANKVS